MKVILLKDVPGTGRKNEIKEVSDGFAKNYLLARKLAKSATEETIKEAIRSQKMQTEKSAKETAIFKEMTARLNALDINLPIKVNTEGVIFGSVNSHMIATELKKAGFDIKKEQIKLMSPIKALGIHNIPIVLKEEIEATVKINVVKESK